MTVHVTADPGIAEGTLDRFQQASLGYFDRESHPISGLVSDSDTTGSHASIAGTGFGLACNVLAAGRGSATRLEAAQRTLTTLRFLTTTRESSSHGFFYHFLDPVTGQRAGKCEISTMDSSLLFAGAIVVSQYFDGDSAVEREVRSLADNIYLRADWRWASPREPVVSHGWTPEKGFLRYDWRGYNEALLLYILALGSPSHPVSSASYDAWLTSYKWKSLYGHELLYAGPLFIHQMPHAFIDFRGIADGYMRGRRSDYFENSRRATYVQREYAMRNPRQFARYGENCWGVSASAGPNSGKFFGYRARGVPYGPDDGTISPLATAASLPFAPEIVLPALEHMQNVSTHESTWSSCFNATYSPDEQAWTSSHSYAIDEGVAALMIENHRSDLIWALLRKSPYIVRGLERAGFTGGWLDEGL
ncbi:MAG TPA: glucoamylase family protein [Gemmatimonadaceae bacterium]|nr:glucoamylase family protein [Gemmatimonadaceae bacterium]